MFFPGIGITDGVMRLLVFIFGAGILSIVGGFGYLIYWLITHVRFI